MGGEQGGEAVVLRWPVRSHDGVRSLLLPFLFLVLLLLPVVLAGDVDLGDRRGEVDQVVVIAAGVQELVRGNARRARVRALVEYVFAAQKCRLGLVIRSVGLARARAKLGVPYLVTNMRRMAWVAPPAL